jgi:hypothetical protein
MMIKHPLWFSIATVITLLITIYVTGSIAYRWVDEKGERQKSTS